MPRNPKDSTTTTTKVAPTPQAAAPKTEAVANSKVHADIDSVFDLNLLPESMFQPSRWPGFTLPQIHDHQRQLNSFLQQEPAVTELFATLMHRHYEYLKEQGLTNNHTPNLYCYDISTSVLTYLISYFKGVTNFADLQPALNTNAFYATTLHTILP